MQHTESNAEQRKRAVDLTAADLGHWVSVVDYAGRAHTGRLDRITVRLDPGTRVVLDIAKQEPINESDGGGWYWATFLSDRFVDRDTIVGVGAVAPSESSEPVSS